MGLARLWQSWGIEPDVVLGHSVGQYAAACVAGVFGIEDGARLIAERGRLFGQFARGWPHACRVRRCRPGRGIRCGVPPVVGSCLQRRQHGAVGARRRSGTDARTNFPAAGIRAIGWIPVMLSTPRCSTPCWTSSNRTQAVRVLITASWHSCAIAPARCWRGRSAWTRNIGVGMPGSRSVRRQRWHSR